jgi:hypothetical protein
LDRLVRQNRIGSSMHEARGLVEIISDQILHFGDEVLGGSQMNRGVKFLLQFLLHFRVDFDSVNVSLFIRLVWETHQKIGVDLGGQVRGVDDAVYHFDFVSLLLLALRDVAVAGSETNFAFSENVFKEGVERVERGSPGFSDFLALK